MARKTEAEAPAPLYKQLEESFVQNILSGRLKPGEAVPSTYSLAEQFGISRVTAVRCYEHLKARGFLTARRGGATIVNPTLPAAALHRRSTEDFSSCAEMSRFDNCQADLLPDSQQPPHAALPSKAWLRAMGQVLNDRLPEFHGPGAHRLSVRLKEAVTAFLIRSRGISLYPRNLLLFDSKQEALAFAARNFLESGGGVALESPGDTLAHEVFRSCGCNLFGMAIDPEGALIDQLQSGSGIKLIVVNPSAQFPTGVVLSERRRQQVARFAGYNDALILEDDSASLIRYGKQPEPCLFNKFRNSLQIGTFSAYLGPLCRISYLVVPDHLLERLHAVANDDFSQPRLEMLVLSHLIETGALDLAIFKMRSRLARDRQEMLFRLQHHFKGLFAIGPGSTGYKLVVRFHSGFQRDTITDEIRNCDLDVHMIQNFYLEAPESSRVELLLPLLDNELLIEKLFELKQMLTEQPSEQFAPLRETDSLLAQMPISALPQFSHSSLSI